jgi:hypothetical protein
LLKNFIEKIKNTDNKFFIFNYCIFLYSLFYMYTLYTDHLTEYVVIKYFVIYTWSLLLIEIRYFSFLWPDLHIIVKQHKYDFLWSLSLHIICFILLLLIKPYFLVNLYIHYFPEYSHMAYKHYSYFYKFLPKIFLSIYCSSSVCYFFSIQHICIYLYYKLYIHFD